MRTRRGLNDALPERARVRLGRDARLVECATRFLVGVRGRAVIDVGNFGAEDVCAKTIPSTVKSSTVSRNLPSGPQSVRRLHSVRWLSSLAAVVAAVGAIHNGTRRKASRREVK